MTKLYGIALLPSQNLTEEIVDFQNQEIDHFKSPRLSTTYPLPHMPILQCPYHIDKLTSKSKDIEELIGDIKDKTSTLQNLYLQPRGWYFLGIKQQQWLNDLHNNLLSLTAPLIDKDSIDHTALLPGYSAKEKENYHNYGYRYAGEMFRPHITLGFNAKASSLDDYLAKRCYDKFFGREIIFDSAVIYKAGEHKDLIEIVHKIK